MGGWNSHGSPFTHQRIPLRIYRLRRFHEDTSSRLPILTKVLKEILEVVAPLWKKDRGSMWITFWIAIISTKNYICSWRPARGKSWRLRRKRLSLKRICLLKKRQKSWKRRYLTRIMTGQTHLISTMYIYVLQSFFFFNGSVLGRHGDFKKRWLKWNCFELLV